MSPATPGPRRVAMGRIRAGRLEAFIYVDPDTGHRRRMDPDALKDAARTCPRPRRGGADWGRS